ncbi:hypothetical protein [Allorhizocola rhizosphaerae]|uniref:hypothetical protein n=1 Tax=Allorhizocola rhizosphaerae TaxID=1872709 RepID=UPI000E3D5BD4|nr:hypothetical protein [Allorhizocola rhizosphaerae]
MSDEEWPEHIAEVYGVGTMIAWTPAARGWAGEIFHLVTSSGSYAAKEFLTQRPDVAKIEWQVGFADACRAAGVPNPETLSTVRGDLLLDHPATGRPWLVQRWADGTVPERTDLPTACWLARQAVASAYRLGGGELVPDGPELFATGLAVWLNFLYGQICGALDPAMDDRFRASAVESAGHLVCGIPGLDALTAAARTAARR